MNATSGMTTSRLSLVTGEGMERLDARAWRALLFSTLARGDEGVIVCSRELEVVFANTRAVQLGERFGGLYGRRLPQALATVVSRFEASAESSHAERIVPEKGGALQIELGMVRGVPSLHIVVWLREECLRDERLFAVLNERYGLSRRSFQLTQLLRQGLANRDIARELRLTEATIKAYLHDIYRACGVSSRTALVALVEDLKGR